MENKSISSQYIKKKMNNVFLPSIVVGLGNTGKKTIEVLHKNLQDNYLGRTGISLVSITSNHSSRNNGCVNNDNNGIFQLEFSSEKSTREKVLKDFRLSNIPNTLCNTVIHDFNKNTSRSQIILAASLGEIESGLIGDVLHYLHSGLTAESFTSYICLSLTSSVEGNRIRNEEMYAGLRELSRLGEFGYHIMGLPDEKITSKSVYDFLFIFDSKNNQFDSGKDNDSVISIQLFIENILKESNFLIRDNLFQAIRNTMDLAIDTETILGDCLNSSLRTVQSPTKIIKRNIAIELLRYKLLKEPLKKDRYSFSSINVDWDQVDEEITDWFTDSGSQKAGELYSLIFRKGEYRTIPISESDLSVYIKSFQVCIHHGVETSLRKQLDSEGFLIVENAIQSIIDQINNQLLRNSSEPENPIIQGLFKELVKETQDIAREISEWKSDGFAQIEKFLEHDLEDARDKLTWRNSIQIFSAPRDEIDLTIENFVRNAKNGSNDLGKFLLESLNQYISVDTKNHAGFQIQLTTESDSREVRYFEPDQMQDFVDDCLNYLESNLDIDSFTIEQRITNITQHLNEAMQPGFELIANNKINMRFEHSSYLISRHSKIADKLLTSIFTDMSNSVKTQVFDETPGTEISAIRIFYDIPLINIKKINQLASDYYLDPALYIFRQEQNAIQIEKKIRNLDRGIEKVLLPGKVVDLLFDMDLVNKCLVSSILGILVKESDTNDQHYWKFDIQKTGRYIDPVICEAKNESLKELFNVLQEFTMVLPNDDKYRIERAKHFFYHENRQRFLEDLKIEIDQKKKEADLKELCGNYWKKIHEIKNGGSPIERGMKILIIYEMQELLHSNYEVKKIIGDGGLDELG